MDVRRASAALLGLALLASGAARGQAPTSAKVEAIPLELTVSPGQFLPKGAKVADLADVSSLRVLVPFDRAAVAVGATVHVSVEGQAVAGKVQATLPLPEALAPLRELSTAFAAAWVIL